MAHKKATGSTALGRDSRPKHLGVKVTDGQAVRSGQIIVRQRGTRYHAGVNVRRAGDDTLYAGATGTVELKRKKATNFTGALVSRLYVNVKPKAAA